MKTIVPPALEDYCRAHTSPADPLLEELADHTRGHCRAPQMLTGPVEGAFLRMLVTVTRARRVLEIGTYTGYSALSMAAGLPDDGELITCDIDTETNAIARAFWARSPHGGKIRPVLGPALETIAQLAPAETFDLVFIDADKESYIGLHARFYPVSNTCKIDTMDTKNAKKGSIACRSHGKSSSRKPH
jgi:caffeoyl-CoA O-methyltransferase